MTYGPLRLLVRALDRQVQPSQPGLDGFGAGGLRDPKNEMPLLT